MTGRYEWGADAPPLLDEHSAAKHRVLRRYVEHYIRILCSDPRRERLRLVVVDGFCGGGMYQDGAGVLCPGSPLLLRQALQAGRACVLARRREIGMHKPFELDATLYLNDSDPAAIAALQSELARLPREEWAPDTFVSCLDFREAASRLVEVYRKERRPPRMIFVLDQYGFSDATLPVMKSLFSAFPKTEIVLTFAVDALANFASPDNVELYRRILANAGFDQAITAEQLTSLKAEDYGAKHLIQTLLLRELFPRTGARFATPFFIIPRHSRRGYWLVHLANNARANDEMKQLHWMEHNHFMHFGHEGVGILAFDPLRLEESQFTFDFGDFAHERTADALMVDLPRFVTKKFPSGTTLAGLLEAVANETPATREMLRKALFELGRAGELDVRTEHGRSRKHVDRLQLDDLIVPQRQMFLFR